MALTVGTNSYGTLEGAVTYFTMIGKTTEWNAVGDDTAKEAKMHQAYQYMGMLYDAVWKGSRTVVGQDAPWPRTGVYIYDNILIDSDTIPDALASAQYEYALVFNSVNLLATYNTDETRLIEKKIGPITKKWSSAGSGSFVTVPSVELLLLPYISGSSNMPGSSIKPMVIGI